jgi:hypothetical protein
VAADLGGAHDGDEGVPREVDRLGAQLIWFPGSGAGGSHGYQFSLITHDACAVTRRLEWRAGRRSADYQEYWLHVDVRGDAANR